METNQILRHVTSMQCALRIYQCCYETIYGLVEMPRFNQSPKATCKANLTQFKKGKKAMVKGR